MFYAPTPNQTQDADWAQKYRPKTLEEMILPSATKDRLINIREQRAGISLMLHGNAGTGKSTAARLLSEGGENYFINCSLNRGIEMVKEINQPGMYTPMIFGGKRHFILDEADYLTPDAQAAFRGVIESLSVTSVFIFTANFPERLIDPLHSRLLPVHFKFDGDADMIRAMTMRAVEILELEGVDLNKATVANIVREYFPDMRRVLKQLQYQVGLKKQ